VGKAAEQQLWSMGIRTLGALALADEAQLTRAFGKMGRQLRIYAAGEDDSPVAAQHESEQVKSIGNGITFKRDLQGLADIRTGAGYLADEVASRLRKKALKCTVVQVQIKSPALQSISRQKTLARETDLGKEIAEAAVQLICANWRLTEPIRALTITAERLVTGPVPRQMGLFDTEEMPPDPAREKLERAMDTLREKYGQGAVSAANLIGNDLGLAQPDQND
ncbi:MAG: DNA polymerase IV, partial [Pygmaiobacter sp.]